MKTHISRKFYNKKDVLFYYTMTIIKISAYNIHIYIYSYLYLSNATSCKILSLHKVNNVFF